MTHTGFHRGKTPRIFCPRRCLSLILSLLTVFSLFPTVMLTATEADAAPAQTGESITVNVTVNPDYTVTATWSEISDANLYGVWFMAYELNYSGNGTGTFRQVRSAASVPAFKGTSYTFDTEFTSEYGFGHSDFMITVEAYDSSMKKLARGDSPVFQTNLPIMPSPQLTFSDTGYIRWTQVDNIDTVAVYLYKKNGNEKINVEILPMSDLSVDFSDYIERGVQYYACIEPRRVKPGYRGFGTVVSDVITAADVRDPIEDLMWSSDTLSWEAFPDATTYGLWLYKDKDDGIRQVGSAVSTHSTNYDFTSLLNRYGTGTYQVKVQAWGTQSDMISKDTFSPIHIYYCPPITSFEVFGIKEPVAGEKPVADCQIPEDAGYRKVLDNDGYLTWYNEDGDVLDPDTYVFKAGERYNARVTLTALADHEFAKSGLTGTMNGKDATKSIFIAKKKTTIYMSRWFTCTAPGAGIVGGTVTSFLSDTDVISIRLLQNGSVKYSVFKKGNNVSYSFPNVANGKYTLTVSKSNHVTREYAITVSGNTSQDVKIHLLGDITGDGKITNIDYTRAKAHARGGAKLTDYALKVADVMKNDGLVTGVDATRIKSVARGNSSLW